MLAALSLAVAFLLTIVGCASDDLSSTRSITDTSIIWPGWDQVGRVLSMRDYNTRVVVIGTTLLGLAAGVMGTYMLLRRRALIGDALAHATLPGIALAFIVMVSLGGQGKNLAGLLLGATVTGLLGVGAILYLKSATRIREDAALGIVLSVFFGAGVALLGVIQSMPTGNAAGLETFIYGKTASMVADDAWVIAIAAGAVIALCALLFKEFAILSFDRGFAAAQGWPVTWIDIVMMAGVTGVTVIGLQAVGLILIVALLIVPPAAARFWTDGLRPMLAISGLIGAVSGLVGALLSALVPRMPAGAIIVVVAALIFVLSLALGRRRGAWVRLREHLRQRRTIGRQHLLRAIHELAEESPPNEPVDRERLLEQRSWSAAQLNRLIAAARREGMIQPAAAADPSVRLTDAGSHAADRLARNHRLWELYLITYADVAPSHVDRDADMIEHVLGQEMVAELEALLPVDQRRGPIPSPHALAVHSAVGQRSGGGS